jgi:LacI family transcriptional regulator
MATIRTLAAQLGLSRATVSEALRGLPRVNVKTVARVQAAAEAAGYRSNPLAAALMSQMRRSEGGTFRGVLALVEVEDDGRPGYAKQFPEKVRLAARKRARELGFEAERLAVSSRGVSVKRLDGILKARGIHGIILLPCWGEPHYEQLDWPKYAGIYTDYSIHHPPLNTVCPDHHRNMIEALVRVRAAGYRRPGLVLSKHIDERLHHRWEGAFLVMQSHQAQDRPVVPLRSTGMEVEEAEFRAWFRKHRPDVVICHWTRVIPWMIKEGAKVPETHGFVCLNLLMAEAPCAGIDLQPELIGRRSAEAVIANLQQNEFGVPATSAVLSVAGRWQEGPTLTDDLSRAGNS